MPKSRAFVEGQRRPREHRKPMLRETDVGACVGPLQPAGWGYHRGVPTTRMNREQFFAKLAALDEERLKKALWNVYWRGSATMRERIEAELDPDERDRRRQLVKEPIDSHEVLYEVREFVALARSGAYLGGDRRVSPRERTRWRFTFQRLVADAQDALQGEAFDAAATAVEQLVDLACEMRAYDYVRSEDPIEAARFVVSDMVALLWGKVRDRFGFAGFAGLAAPQLIRWESRFGWTRSGWGRVADKEASLASVLAGMLGSPICGSDSPIVISTPSTRSLATTR